MRDHTDILIDAIGKVNDRYIEKSAPSDTPESRCPKGSYGITERLP